MKKVYLERGQGKKPLEVHTSFVQVFRGAGTGIYQITGTCSHHLLHWLLVNMNTYNVVILNSASRGDFIADVISNSGRRYAHSTIKQAINELIKHDLMISMSDPGKREASYMMNPNHFWRSPKRGDRFETVKAYKFKKEQHETN